MKDQKAKEGTRTVSQAPKKGLITEEFLKYTLSNIRSSLYFHEASKGDPRTIKTRRFSNPEYYPFYSLNFSPDSALPYSNILNNDFEMDEYEKRYGGSVWKKNAEYVGFIKKCLEKKHYNLLLLTNHTLLGTSNKATISSYLAARLNSFLNAPYSTNFSNSCFTLSGSYQDMFNSIKMCNGWAIYAARKATGETSRRTYLCNMFFLASLGGNYVGTLNGLNIKPLFCLMVKKENMPLVRAYFAANLPIPVSMLELWVDESVEAEGSKIKPHFRKFIKSKMEAASVPIRYVSDLSKETIVGFDIPKFKTQDQYSEWANGMVASMYDVQKGVARYCKDTNANLPNPKIDGIRKIFLEQIEEVLS